METFFTLANTRFYLPENVSIVDRRPRRQVIIGIGKKRQKPRRPDIILLFSCLPGGLLSNTINFIPSYYRPAASDSVCVYNNIYLSQQNRNSERHYIQRTIADAHWYIIYICILYIHLYNIDCANIGYFLYNPFTGVDNIMKFFVFCIFLFVSHNPSFSRKTKAFGAHMQTAILLSQNLRRRRRHRRQCNSRHWSFFQERVIKK